MRLVPASLLLGILALAAVTQTARADALDADELAELKRYLTELKMGRPCSAATVERLAGVSFAGLRLTMQTYAELPPGREPVTHRAFQVLLERTSREALSPWSLVTLYSPQFARFLSEPLADNTLSARLFDQLRLSDGGRQAFDLIVRLTPEASLQYLASEGKDNRVELLDAWNRRLALGRERRPIANLAKHLDAIAGAFSLDLPAAELEAHLRFLASWPALAKAYESQLARCLDHAKAEIVLAGLTVQHRAPRLLDRNETIIGKFSNPPKLVEQALRNYAFDERTDHSATLRRLWARLPADDGKARYQCLFAMAIHSRGNDELALQAIQQDAYELIDVALLVLRRGDPEKARKAIRHVLDTSKRGHEEALRAAAELKLIGFEDDAINIALDGKRDQVLRQTAIMYSQRSPGIVRRRLLPLLVDANGDLRLAAIRAFGPRDGLTPADLNEVGPSLIKVALADPSMGCRQEAIFAVGCWKAPLAADFFRKVLADNPPVILSDGYYGDQRYWQYRFRLMGLLGAARLGEQSAREELLALHKKGSPAERMDVLLAFLDLREVPEVAFADLGALEPKLVATAAQLIARHGDDAARQRMRKLFRASPLWREFVDSGIDDHNILGLVGLKANE